MVCIQVKSSFLCRDHYFVFAGWVSSSVAMVTWMNRSSDSAVYCAYFAEGAEPGLCSEMYTATSPAWIELVSNPTSWLREKSLLVAREGELRFLSLSLSFHVVHKLHVQCVCKRKREGGREGAREGEILCVCVFVRLCVCLCRLNLHCLWRRKKLSLL